MTGPFGTVADILTAAIGGRVFPGAAVEVGTSARPRWRHTAGALSYAPDSSQVADDTIYDLASLTKVLATTPLVLRQAERGILGLDDPVARWISSWRGGDRDQVTIRDLLAHCSGLPGHRAFYETIRGREAFEHAVCSTPLEYAPRTRSVYSDLGFMLLGFLLEDIAPLDVQFDALRGQMRNAEDLQFHPPATWTRRTAPTRRSDWRGHLLIGEVDDDNASALGGAAGHAGLFGTAAAVGSCARHVMQILEGRVGALQRETLRAAVSRRDDVPDSSRALGWDTMRPTSSCGTKMSPRAFGHTGFTGTSLWIDPDAGLYVVLLTNRVHPEAVEDDRMQVVRRAVHDAVMTER